MKIEKVIRKYTNLGGVDFLNNEVSLFRSPDSKNMYKSYKKGNLIETRLGIKKILEITGVVYGLYFFEHSNGLKVIVHAGTKLYEWTNFPNKVVKNEDLKELYVSMSATKSSFFVFNNKLYVLDGSNYLVYDGLSCEPVSKSAFIPITTIGRSPSGGGTFYQAVNLLSPWRYNYFVGNDNDTIYHLDVLGLDKPTGMEETIEVKIDGNIVSDYEVDYDSGTITFNNAPGSPQTPGDNNVVIKCKKTIQSYEERIAKCTLLIDFDNRVFFSGNPTFPNTLFHSELENPSYITDLAYYSDGLDTSSIKSLIVGNNQLWALKEAGQGNATVYYHVPTIDYQHGKIYPSRKGKVSTGCVSEGINFRDDIIFVSKEGLMGITGDIESEQLLGNRSSLINPKFINENNYNKTQLENWNSYLVCLVNDKLYLADSKQKYPSLDGFEYEWYLWDGFKINSESPVLIKSYNNDLFVGYDGYIGVFNETSNEKIESYWTTPNDNFGYSNKEKTTNKRGSLIKFKGNCSVAIKTKGRFEPITSITTTELDNKVFRVKKKKWLESQLKVYSINRFELEHIIMEAFIGGYKRR